MANNSSVHSSVTSFTVHRYDINSLYRIRPTVRLSVSSTNANVISRLKCLGILRYRGRRSGNNYQRKINVIVNERYQLSKCDDLKRNSNRSRVVNTNLIYPIRHSDNGKSISFLCQNVRSATNKTAAICNLIEVNRIDIAVLTETWLNDTDTSVFSLITPAGYYYIHKGREIKPKVNIKSQNTYGGIGIVVSENIQTRIINLTLDITTFEYLVCKVMESPISFIIVAVYRPGSKPATKKFFSDFTSLLEIIATFSSPVFIVGDFNIRLDRPDDTNAVAFLDLLKICSLTQHIQDPTHDLGGMLDLVITNDLSIGAITDVSISPSGISDHFMVSWRYHSSGLVNNSSINRSANVRQWRLMNLNHFECDLSDSLLCNSLTDLDGQTLSEVCSLYNMVLEQLVNIHAPLKTIKSNNKSAVSPWFNAECNTAKKCAVKLKRRYYKSQNAKDRSNWITQLKANTKVYQRVRDNYWSTKLQTEVQNPKKLWANLNCLLGRGNNLGTQSTGLNADQFLQFFENKANDVSLSTQHAPPPVITSTVTCTLTLFRSVSIHDVVTLIKSAPNKQCALDPMPMWLMKSCASLLGPIVSYIVNRSFTEGQLPTAQKVALVRPLIKKPNMDQLDLKSYRPISNLSFLSKLIERCVNAQLTDYLNYNKLFATYQSAYRAGHSTETALLKTYSDWVDAIDKGDYTLLCLLDMSAAFDTVDHIILLERLQKQYGLCGLALQWIQSYLHDRSQTVIYRSGKSQASAVKIGVPQGSVLGPLLFQLYTADIQNIIQAHNLLAHVYADDNQVYFHAAKSEIDKYLDTLSACINDISNWMASNRLRLNPDKTEAIWFSSSRRVDSIPTNVISVGTNLITPSTTVRSLGVTFDNALNMKSHVSKVVSACFNQLRLIRSIKNSLSQDNLKLLLHAFVSSRLDYCNSLLVGQSDDLLHRLQMVQNAAVRLYASLSRRSNIIETMRDDLHWLTIPFRITFKVCVMVFRCLHGNAPEYLSEYCVRLSDQSTRISCNRSATHGNLEVPRTRLKTYGNRSFATAGPLAWNALPTDLKTESDFVKFKSKLKTHLFRICYY